MMRKLAFIAALATGVCQAQNAAPTAAETVKTAPVPTRPERPARRPGGPNRTGVPQQRGNFAPAIVPMERMKQAAAELLGIYDTDKDGKLSADEKAVLEREMAEAENKARLARDYMRIKAIDVDGNLVISPEEEDNSQQRLREAARKRIEALQQNRAQQGVMPPVPAAPAPAPAPEAKTPAPAPAAPAAPEAKTPAPAPAAPAAAE